MDGSGDGEELGGAEEGEAIIAKYYVSKTSIFNKGEKTECQPMFKYPCLNMAGSVQNKEIS